MSASGPGQLLFAFVRHWSRRSLAGVPSLADRGRLVLATEAVETLVGRRRSATVNAVADEIGIDQSGASRMIGAAIEAGFVAMTTAVSDGRRRELSVTPVGHRLLTEARAWQERIFDDLTEGWSRRRREEFQSAMSDLLRRSTAREELSFRQRARR